MKIRQERLNGGNIKDLDGIELNEEEQRDRMEMRENIRVQE